VLCSDRQACLQAYRERCVSLDMPQDDALAALLAFLVLYLEPVQKKMRSRRQLVKRVFEWAGATLLSTSAIVAGAMMIGSRQN
jgi:hypothetical protein